MTGPSTPASEPFANRRLLRFQRSTDGYGWRLDFSKRVRWNSRKATSRMWPSLHHGADEVCNRAITLVLWPLGSLDVWWEPTWRTRNCDDCRAEHRARNACEDCGCRPCACTEDACQAWADAGVEVQEDCPACGHLGLHHYLLDGCYACKTESEAS